MFFSADYITAVGDTLFDGLGKPIEILGESSVQHWQNQTNFDRQEMLEHIAHSQFNRDEFADGTAWRVTMQYQQTE